MQIDTPTKSLPRMCGKGKGGEGMGKGREGKGRGWAHCYSKVDVALFPCISGLLFRPKLEEKHRPK